MITDCKLDRRKGDFLMIDGWPEAWEQEFMGYLLARECTTPAELAHHFHLSDSSAAYWLGRFVKSGRLRIARIEGHATDESTDSAVGEETLQERNARDVPQAVLQVPGGYETIWHAG